MFKCFYDFIFSFEISLSTVTISDSECRKHRHNVAAGKTASLCHFNLAPRATWASHFRARYRVGGACSTCELGHLSLLCAAGPANHH